MVAQVADSIFIPFTVGGGIRTVDDFNALRVLERIRYPSIQRRSETLP